MNGDIKRSCIPSPELDEISPERAGSADEPRSPRYIRHAAHSPPPRLSVSLANRLNDQRRNPYFNSNIEENSLIRGRRSSWQDRCSTPPCRDRHSIPLIRGRCSTPPSRDRRSTPPSRDRHSTPNRDRHSIPLIRGRCSTSPGHDRRSTPSNRDRHAIPLIRGRRSTSPGHDRRSTPNRDRHAIPHISGRHSTQTRYSKSPQRNKRPSSCEGDRLSSSPKRKRSISSSRDIPSLSMEEKSGDIELGAQEDKAKPSGDISIANTCLKIGLEATVECIDSAKSPDQFTDLAPAPVELVQEKLVGIGVPREKTSNSVISDPVLQSSNEHVTAGEDSHKKNMATKNVAEPSDSDKTSSQKYQGVEKESLEVRNDENKLKENEGQSKNRNAEKDVKQDGEYQSHKSMYRHSKEDGKKYEEVGRKTGSEKTEKERQIKFDRVDNRKSEEGGRRKPIEKGMKKLDEVDHKKSGELVCKKTDEERCTKSEDGRRHGNSDEKSRTKPYERGQKNRDERRNKNHDERGHKNNDERSKAKLPSQEKTLENLDKPDKKARDTVSDTIASGKMVLGRKEPTDDLSDDKNENGKNLLRSERVRSKSRSNSQGENRLSTRMDRKPRDAWNRRLPERRKRSSEVDSPASENRMRLHSRSPRRSGHFLSDRNRRSPPFRHRSSDSHILKRECNSPENSRLHDRRINNPEAPYHESKIYPRNLGTRPPDCRDGLFSRTFAAGNEHRFSSVHSLPNSGIPPLFPRNTSIHHEHGIHGHMSPPWVPSRGNTRSPDRYFSQSERHRSPLRRTPDRFRRTPERLRRTPDRFRRMPGSLRRTPDQFGRTPDQLRRTPDQFRRTPDRFRRTPDRFLRTPDRFRKTPDRVRDEPGFDRSSRGRSFREHTRSPHGFVPHDESSRSSVGISTNKAQFDEPGSCSFSADFPQRSSVDGPREALQESTHTSGDDNPLVTQALASIAVLHNDECRAYMNMPTTHPLYNTELSKYLGSPHCLAIVAEGTPLNTIIEHFNNGVWMNRLQEIFEEDWQKKKLELLKLMKNSKKKSRHSKKFSSISSKKRSRGRSKSPKDDETIAEKSPNLRIPGEEKSDSNLCSLSDATLTTGSTAESGSPNEKPSSAIVSPKPEIGDTSSEVEGSLSANLLCEVLSDVGHSNCTSDVTLSTNNTEPCKDVLSSSPPDSNHTNEINCRTSTSPPATKRTSDRYSPAMDSGMLTPSPKPLDEAPLLSKTSDSSLHTLESFEDIHKSSYSAYVAGHRDDKERRSKVNIVSVLGVVNEVAHKVGDLAPKISEILLRVQTSDARGLDPYKSLIAEDLVMLNQVHERLVAIMNAATTSFIEKVIVRESLSQLESLISVFPTFPKAISDVEIKAWAKITLHMNPTDTILFLKKKISDERQDVVQDLEQLYMAVKELHNEWAKSDLQDKISFFLPSSDESSYVNKSHAVSSKKTPKNENHSLMNRVHPAFSVYDDNESDSDQAHDEN